MSDIVDFGDGNISIVFCCNCELYIEEYGICRRTGKPCVKPTDGCSYGFVKRSKRSEGIEEMDMDSMLLEQSLKEDEKYLCDKRKISCYSCSYANRSENKCSRFNITLDSRNNCIEGKPEYINSIKATDV